MSVVKLPRVTLGHWPTPLHELPRLSATLGGPRLFVKRDDLTGLALGGNKCRKLEYILGDARQKGIDTLITSGSSQSNFALQMAAAARRLGMEPYLILVRGIHSETQGNLLLHSILNSVVNILDVADPIEMFTTNYDILLERSLELSATPLFDGFVGAHNPFFLTDSLDREELLPPADWVRLWKIHGSINWQLADSFQPERIIRTQPTLTGEMILPSHRKYDESRKQPYTALLDRLGRVLNREHSLLITCGFSFSDEHINSLIFSVLDNQPTANVISLQHGELSQDTPIVKWALARTNLKVIGPNAGVISGRWGTWHLLNPVDNSTSAFMDLAFDSNAWEETEGGEVDPNAGVRIGQMRLGDFNWFCQFLNTMRSRTEEKQ